jgi:hypothetical protein
MAGSRISSGRHSVPAVITNPAFAGTGVFHVEVTDDVAAVLPMASGGSGVEVGVGVGVGVEVEVEVGDSLTTGFVWQLIMASTINDNASQQVDERMVLSLDWYR